MNSRTAGESPGSGSAPGAAADGRGRNQPVEINGLRRGCMNAFRVSLG